MYQSITQKIKDWQKQRREKTYVALTDEKVAHRLQLLLGLVEKRYPSLPRLMIRNFIGGLFTALGATLGLSIFLALLTYFLVQVQAVPIIGEYIKDNTGYLDGVIRPKETK